MSGAGGIETSQLVPRDDDAQEQRAAAIACADYAQREQLPDSELLELLRELGLAHDPYARDRDMVWGTKGSHLRGPEL